MRRKKLLTDNALQHLASLVAAVDAAEASDLAWRDEVRIHFLRNFTIEPVEPYLKFHLLREDIRPLVTFGGYDTMSQEILDPGSSINEERPDIIVLSLLLDYLDSGCTAKKWNTDEALRRLEDLLALALDHTSSLIIANTLLPPIDLLLNDSADADRIAQVRQLNDRMRQLADTNPQRIRIADWEQTLVEFGTKKTIDKRFWKLSQAPFTAPVLNRIAKDVAKQIRALKGSSKKCLVLDCDNTLWGGVIGEDGMDGIELHPDELPGSAFYKVQQSAIELHEQGILLALVAKTMRKTSGRFCGHIRIVCSSNPIL